MIIADYSEESRFSLDELCDVCQVPSGFVFELIEYAILHPEGEEDAWIFNVSQLARLQTTMRLQRDLEVNLAGAALVLDLLDEIEDLENKVALLEKHLLKK